MGKVEFEKSAPNPVHENVTDILPEELLSKMSPIQIIDVRRPDEYTGELGHIPGAHLCTLDTLSENLSSFDKNKTTVFVCRSGGRSGQAAAFAYQLGWTDIFNMKGGMIAWNELGYEIEK